MDLAHRWSDRNLSRMELVSALLMLAVLIGFFSRYTLITFSRTEQSLVNSTVININTALYYRASLATMLNEYENLKKMIDMNPMEEMRSMQTISDADLLLDRNQLFLASGSFSTPTNYRGVIYSESDLSLEKGKWYFNQTEKHLVYIVNNDELFTTDLEGPARIRFHVVFNYEDNNTNGQFDADSDQFLSMKLSPVDYYQWEQ